MNYITQQTAQNKNMKIKFEKPVEAFAAIAWIIIAADKNGSIEERDFLYQRIKGLDVFINYRLAEFSQLLGATFLKIFPKDEYSIAEESVDSLIASARNVLSLKLRMDAFEMAVGLANADGICDEEKILLKQLQNGFAIDVKTAQRILNTETSGKLETVMEL